jgi:hypothetical protein
MVSDCRKEFESQVKISPVIERVGKDGKVYNAQKQATTKKKPTAKVTTSETTTTKEVHEYPVEAEFVE